MGHYEFGEHADVYTQLMFNDYESVAQIAPSGNFGDTTTVNCGNPFLPVDSLGDLYNTDLDGNVIASCDPNSPVFADTISMYILRRNVEGGGRQQSFANNSFRAVAGLRGAINEGWGYDVSAQYSSVAANSSTLNYFVIERLQRALLVDDVGGVPTCRSVIDGSDLNCVPWNPFQPGGITQDQLDYLQASGLQIGRISQEIYNGVVNGDLGVYGIQTPWATDGVQVVFGAEYRRDALSNEVDALQEQAQLAGSGGATIGIEGSTKVNELFFEGRIPLAQDKAFAESLSFDTAYRYSDYGDGVQTDTYKLGLEWAPIADVRLRGSYQRAVRAANIVELFTAQGFNLFDATGDPCGAAARDPEASVQECIDSGVPASLVGSGVLDSPAGQYQFLQGGNTELVPETSDTYSYGVVFQPRFAPGLAITVDYFDIKIEDTITTFRLRTRGRPATATTTRRPAIASIAMALASCGLATDTSRTRTSTSVRCRPPGGTSTSGTPGVEIGRFGSLAFNMTGTYLVDLITQPAPGIDLNPDPDVVDDTYDCTGFYSSVCLTPNPQWRHRFRTSWQTPWDVDLSLTWRYYHETEGLTAANNPLPHNRIDRILPAENYFDLAANWAITDKAGVTLGINNVLDDNPSLSASVGTTGNGNTYPQTYDALGRYVFLRATVDF